MGAIVSANGEDLGMTRTSLNPFNSLYRTESISADAFVNLFSPILLKESLVQRLFEPGNVVLCGLQGSGKSALLNLLKPEVLIEFINSKSADWPLPAHCSRFVSASITLRSSGALLFGQRVIEDIASENERVVGLYFADFLNYWIVSDLLKNIELLFSERGRVLAERIGVLTDPALLDEFAKLLSSSACWHGALSDVDSFKKMKSRLDARIQSYDSFLNYNSDFPSDVSRTKTSAGEPIAVTSDCLKKVGILPRDVPVFVTIDQFEDLMDLERDLSEEGKPIFRSVIMRMLGSRDDRISYRVGARLYSLDRGIRGLSGNALVEEMREVNLVNIDELLQIRENRGSLFPDFCDDVLRRRLTDAGYSNVNAKATSQIFGKNATPEDKVKAFISRSRTRITSAKFLDDVQNEEVSKVLDEIALTDPLSAKLGEAWVRQNSTKNSISAERIRSTPWISRPWWKKERKQQAMLQVFAACGQKMVWYGAADIIGLSGRNILTFLSICQFVWAELLRGMEDGPNNLPENIDPIIQTLGINSASEYWFRKIKAEPKGGDDRNRFANEIGNLFRDMLRSDRSMSYPGHNGFSLPSNSLDAEPVVDNFLSDCVAFGVLESRSHTPKTRSRGRSEKWYLSPILSPHFQIPIPHIKEPYYASISEVADWMRKARVVTIGISADLRAKRRSLGTDSDSDQLKFPFGD